LKFCHFSIGVPPLKLPTKYQELVWNKKIWIGIIGELLPLLNGEVNRTVHEITKLLDRTITDKHFGSMQVEEYS